MTSIGSMIADAAAMGPQYAKRLVTGIPADRFARFAAPAGEVIQANHPAFILGHLSLYPIKVVQLLRADLSSADLSGGYSSKVTPPETYASLFSKDAICQDDTDGTLYPEGSSIIAFFEQSYAAALEAMREASDAQLSVPNPVDSPMKEVLPTLGSLLAFYLTGHVMVHMGQLSTWRRMEKLPPA